MRVVYPRDLTRLSIVFRACARISQRAVCGRPVGSTLRRERVVSVAVALADLAVFAVDEKFGLLVAGDLDGFPLRRVDGRDFFVALAAHGLAVSMGNNMLILMRHLILHHVFSLTWKSTLCLCI